MTQFNYPKIYSNFVQDLPQKIKEVLNRRFGIGTGKRETLEEIGEGFGITRERVRQIEERGFSIIKEKNQLVLGKIYQEFISYFKNKGGLKREDLALKDLGGKNSGAYVLFFLSLGESFMRVCEKKDFHYFWTIEKNSQSKFKKILDLLIKKLKEEKKVLPKNDFISQCSIQYNLTSESILSHLEISKRIKENKEGGLGLIEWPEINPKGVKDKAFLAFKKENRPLHFTKVAELIEKLEFNLPNKKIVPQTVHNELIRDQRFVLVGRGTYALREWGYLPGTVKDVILNVLNENKKPMDKDEIVEKVLSQRCVAVSTILINLNDKKSFSRDTAGKYILKKTQLA